MVARANAVNVAAQQACIDFLLIILRLKGVVELVKWRVVQKGEKRRIMIVNGWNQGRGPREIWQRLHVNCIA